MGGTLSWQQQLALPTVPSSNCSLLQKKGSPAGNLLFLKELFLCLSLALRASLRRIFLASTPDRGGHVSRNVHEPNHKTHEAHNKTAKEAKSDRKND